MTVGNILQGVTLTAETRDLPPDLFDQRAQQLAQLFAKTASNVNKPTQLRRFFDEVVNWQQQVRRDPANYNSYLPMIRMINAKVAYAEARNLVDRNFREFITHCVRQLEENKPLGIDHFRLLFEAVMGFYKGEAAKAGKKD